jgi:hypothetical protein
MTVAGSGYDGNYFYNGVTAAIPNTNTVEQGADGSHYNIFTNSVGASPSAVYNLNSVTGGSWTVVSNADNKYTLPILTNFLNGVPYQTTNNFPSDHGVSPCPTITFFFTIGP